MTILGISIGSTETGVCILQNGVLIDWQVHKFTHQWSDNKLRIIINRYKQYIQKHDVKHIMVKIPPLAKQKAPVIQIQKRMVTLAKKLNCSIDYIFKSEIKQRLVLENTDEIVELARRYYPVLTHIYEKGVHNKHAYYIKLYEAVLSAHLYSAMHSEK